MKEKIKKIGEIENYYGGLSVKLKNGKYYWGIENWSGTSWREITKELYEALLKFEEERKLEEDKDE